MNFVDDLELIQALAWAGGDFMTKAKYEQQLHELEEKEGKLFTIPEISRICGVDQTVIRSSVCTYDIPFIKIRHYKTQQNQTLIPERGVLMILALHTPCLRMFYAWRNIASNDSGMTTIEDAIAKLEEFQRKA